jgi:hypothetical protein
VFCGDEKSFNGDGKNYEEANLNEKTNEFRRLVKK